jgi:hypothetical protein
MTKAELRRRVDFYRQETLDQQVIIEYQMQVIDRFREILDDNAPTLRRVAKLYRPGHGDTKPN